MQRVIGAVADGDLSKKVSADVRGEMLELKNTINAMVDQLNGFVSEVTRVAREVGTEGKLGQAAAVTIEVGGVWKDLTDNVNLMAGNLTGQVRNIAEVTTAVANGDLSKKISIDVKGEFLELKNTVNAMVDQLNAFAGEVTRVAREVGVEGKLGGQAQSKEVGGVWKDLTDNVNQLAANLTNQVRAIAEVATAVTEGDLTRQVRVEASGEVAVLKDKLNEMIRNLGETTRQNVEQDWLKTNRERFTRMLQGQRDLATVSDMILSELAPLVSAQHGVFYSMTNPADGGEPVLELQAGYGYEERRHLSTSFRLGEGLVGQCAKEKKRILLTEVPADYVRINSGLGVIAAAQHHRAAGPVRRVGARRGRARLLLAVQRDPSDLPRSAHREHRPRPQHDRGKHAHREPARAVPVAGRRAPLTARGAAGVQRGPRPAGQRSCRAEHRGGAEEPGGRAAPSAWSRRRRASSPSRPSTSPSSSPTCRTSFARPLNSLLMLAEQLEDNPDHNMTDTQVEYASVILASGNDLLKLLNSILDLAKVESGTVTVEMAELSVRELRTALLREFEHVAQSKDLAFSIDVAPGTPEAIVTDPSRLRQILKNLLANAFKFTDARRGDAASSAWPPRDGAPRPSRSSPRRRSWRCLVRDTGVGIERQQQQRIFEAFAQGDGGTARDFRRDRPRPVDQPSTRRTPRR